MPRRFALVYCWRIASLCLLSVVSFRSSHPPRWACSPVQSPTLRISPPTPNSLHFPSRPRPTTKETTPTIPRLLNRRSPPHFPRRARIGALPSSSTPAFSPSPLVLLKPHLTLLSRSTCSSADTTGPEIDRIRIDRKDGECGRRCGGSRGPPSPSASASLLNTSHCTPPLSDERLL